MKLKILFSFIILVFLVTMTGCGGNDKKDNENQYTGPLFGENKCYTTIDCKIISDCIYSLAIDKSRSEDPRVWIGLEKGIMYFEGNEFHKVEDKGLFSDAGIVKDILIENQGERIWFLCENKLIMKRGDEWFPLRDGGGNRLASINGDIYIASPGCLKKYTNGSFHRYNSQNSGMRGELNSDSVNAVCSYNSAIWVGTSSGLVEFKPPATWNQFTGPKKMVRGDGIEIIPGNSGLCNNQIFSFLPTTDGLWIGTAIGVSKYSSGQWKSFVGDHMEVTDGRGNRSMIPGNCAMNGSAIYDICNDGENVFFATDKGISMYNGREWKNFDSKNTEFIGEEVNTIDCHEGWLYAGTSMGFLKMYIRTPEESVKK